MVGEHQIVHSGRYWEGGIYLSPEHHGDKWIVSAGGEALEVWQRADQEPRKRGRGTATSKGSVGSAPSGLRESGRLRSTSRNDPGCADTPLLRISGPSSALWRL